MAAGYRLLAGVAGARPDVDAWAGTLAVAAAVWLLPWPSGYFHDAREAMLEAIERKKASKTEKDIEAGISEDAWREVHRAIARYADYAKSNDTSALVDAVRAARAAVDRAEFHRVFGCALRQAATTGASPMTKSPKLAKAIAAMSESDVAAVELPLAGETGSISFSDVIITNNAAGIDLAWWRRPASMTAVGALHALGADAAGWSPASAYNKMSPPERLEWWEDESLGDDAKWSPMSYFDVMAFLFQQQAHNDGKPMLLDGKAARVVDAVERFGTLVDAAELQSDFPMFFFDFEHASVFGKITY
jgi:hypothetical protein